MVAPSGTPLDFDSLRPLNRPIPLWVQADAAGNPLRLRRRHWRRPRRVARVQDRWRVDDAWWHDRPIARLYHLVRLEDDTLLAIYHDLLTGSWFEQRGIGDGTILVPGPGAAEGLGVEASADRGGGSGPGRLVEDGTTVGDDVPAGPLSPGERGLLFPLTLTLSPEEKELPLAGPLSPGERGPARGMEPAGAPSPIVAPRPKTP